MPVRPEKFRNSQLIEFFEKSAKLTGNRNPDAFFKNGGVKEPADARELGAYFLHVPMGFSEDEFIPHHQAKKESPTFVPVSERYYPWAFYAIPSKEAERLIEEYRSGAAGPDIQLIQVKLINIDSHEFKGGNIRFLNKPAAVIRYTKKDGLRFIFDSTASHGQNGTDIHYYQWDFNYKDRFSPMTKPKFKNDMDGDGNPLNDNRKMEHVFVEHGTYKVALRVIDKSGAEATEFVEVETRASEKKVAA